MNRIPGIIKIMAAIFLGWLVLTMIIHADNSSPAVKTVPVAVQQKQIQKLAEGYLQKEEDLKKSEQDISGQLVASQKKLLRQRMKSNQLLHVLKKTAAKLCDGTDSSICSGGSDTLVEKVAAVIHAEIAKDSLCDEVMGQQQQLLNNKDSIIALEKQQNESWKEIIKNALQQQDLLVSANRLYRKQAKRLKTKKTILSGAVIALSAMLMKSMIK